MFKVNQITLQPFVAYPVHASLFVADLAILLFLPIVRPPVMLSMVLVAGLVYLSMFFGAAFSSSGGERSTPV